MTKTFCDICGEEIKASEQRYRVGITVDDHDDRRLNDDDFDLHQKCWNQIRKPLYALFKEEN